MKKRWMLISSTSIAVVLAVALFLRPSRIEEPRMPVPAHIPADVRTALRARMQQHGAQMTELLMALVVIDHDRAARVAGALYDQTPGLVPGPSGDRVTQFLPAQFFALQTQLKDQARDVVVAAAERNPQQLTERFGAMTKTCVACHQAYLGQ